jgi:hypothetical protein
MRPRGEARVCAGCNTVLGWALLLLQPLQKAQLAAATRLQLQALSARAQRLQRCQVLWRTSAGINLTAAHSRAGSSSMSSRKPCGNVERRGGACPLIAAPLRGATGHAKVWAGLRGPVPVCPKGDGRPRHEGGVAHQDRDEVWYEVQRAERVRECEPGNDFGRPRRSRVLDGIVDGKHLVLEAFHRALEPGIPAAAAAATAWPGARAFECGTAVVGVAWGGWGGEGGAATWSTCACRSGRPTATPAHVHTCAGSALPARSLCMLAPRPGTPLAAYRSPAALQRPPPCCRLRQCAPAAAARPRVPRH